MVLESESVGNKILNEFDLSETFRIYPFNFTQFNSINWKEIGLGVIRTGSE